MNSSNKTKILDEAYRLSELNLNSQIQAAMAADSRAINFAGINVAGAAILCGLAASANSPASLFIGSILLTMSALISFFSARPIGVYMVGTHFSKLKSDLDNDVPFEDVLEQLANQNDKARDENEKQIDKNATLIRVAYVFSIFGLLISIFGNIFNYLN